MSEDSTDERTGMSDPTSRPVVAPSLIACWAALLFIVTILSPNIRVISAQPDPKSPFATVMILLILCAFIGTIWVAYRAAKLRTVPVIIALIILIGQPLIPVANFFVTGYFSMWLFRFMVVMAIINGFCAWYLLRSKVRRFWSPNASRDPA